MASQSHNNPQQELHFVLFPLMAQGHMIPMIDIARLLAQHGVHVTIITTPKNAARFGASIARAKQSGLRIQLVPLRLPCAEAGLPEGFESFDQTTEADMIVKLFAAARMLQEPAETLLRELVPPPSCIISDSLLPWTLNIATKFSIPRISFLLTSCFYFVCLYNLLTSWVGAESETELFVVPGLCDRIELSRAQIMSSMDLNQKDVVEVHLAEEASYGAIVNTFEELEPDYVQQYKDAKEGKVWCVGPVSLCYKEDSDKAERGNKAAIDQTQCLKWLDSFQAGSVIYACLGSLCNLTSIQMIELGLGLEASNQPFIWVVREGDVLQEVDKWIGEDGFEERTRGRGLLIRGWAPQVLILSHPAIGGFLTHCGWNSTLEAISAGLPMVTWPLFADQIINEKMVVQMLRIGVSVGFEEPMRWGKEDKNVGVVVTREVVKNAVEKVMGEGDEALEMRTRVKELREMARRAVGEGGSSHLNVTLLFKDIMTQRSKVGKE